MAILCNFPPKFCAISIIAYFSNYVVFIGIISDFLKIGICQIFCNWWKSFLKNPLWYSAGRTLSCNLHCNRRRHIANKSSAQNNLNHNFTNTILYLIFLTNSQRNNQILLQVLLIAFIVSQSQALLSPNIQILHQSASNLTTL